MCAHEEGIQAEAFLHPDLIMSKLKMTLIVLKNTYYVEMDLNINNRHMMVCYLKHMVSALENDANYEKEERQKGIETFLLVVVVRLGSSTQLFATESSGRNWHLSRKPCK